MADEDKVVQKVGVKFEVDEESKQQALAALEAIGIKGEEMTEKLKKGKEETSKFGEMLSKDLDQGVKKLIGGLGELGSLLTAGGFLAGGVVAFTLIDGKMADLNKSTIDVNNQLLSMKMTSREIADLWINMNGLGFDKDQSASAILNLTKMGAFQNKEDLGEALTTSASMSKQTGIPIDEISTIISQGVRVGILEQGNISGGLANKEGNGLLQNLIKGSTEAEMSLSTYSKSVMDLWQTTRNYNIDFESTGKILNSWHEELNKGIMTVADLAALASGSKMSDSQKLYSAQQAGLTGTPLEMLTKFEHLLSTPEGQEKLGKQIFERANQMAKSPLELMQTVDMMNQTLAGGSFNTKDQRGQADFIKRFGGLDKVPNEFRDLVKTEDSKQIDQKTQRVAEAEKVSKDLTNIQALLENIRENTVSQRSFFGNVKASFTDALTGVSGALANTPSTIEETLQKQKLSQELTKDLDSYYSTSVGGVRSNLSGSMSSAQQQSAQQPQTVKIEHESTIKVITNGQPSGQSTVKKKQGVQSFSQPSAPPTPTVVQLE